MGLRGSYLLYRNFEAKSLVDCCWEWQGQQTPYGRIREGTPGPLHYVHRLAYALWHHRDLAHLHFICHHCDAPACVNPLHLFEGTHVDNVRDAVRKQRIAMGEWHCCAKLSDQDIRAIRAAKAQGQSSRSIAVHYGISIPYINQLARGAKRKRRTPMRLQTADHDLFD